MTLKVSTRHVAMVSAALLLGCAGTAPVTNDMAGEHANVYQGDDEGKAQEQEEHVAKDAKKTWSADEWTAFGTVVLAGLTFVLALCSAAQIYFLKRTDETARLAADAAKTSADAAILAQRPWIKISNNILSDVVIHLPGEECPGSAFAEFKVENIGATPALSFRGRVGIFELNVEDAARRRLIELRDEVFRVNETVYPHNDHALKGNLDIPAEWFHPDKIQSIGVLVVCWYRVYGIEEPRVSAGAYRLNIRLDQHGDELVVFRQTNGTGLGTYVPLPDQPIDPT